MTTPIVHDSITGESFSKDIEDEENVTEHEGDLDLSDNMSEISETGTYTINKEKDQANVEVITARLNIDNTFGVNQETTISSQSDDPNSVSM